jgi:hypothetical protein
MRVRLQEGSLAPVQSFDGIASLVVYDDFEQPILVAQKLEHGAVLVSRCTDPDFKRLISALGIGLNVSCKVISS